MSLSGYPKSLEALGDLNEIWISQDKTWVEGMKSLELPHRFDVLDTERRRIFSIEETDETTQIGRFLAGRSRSLVLRARDDAGETFLQLDRPFQVKAAFLSFLNVESTGWQLQISSPPGNKLGLVRQTTALARKVFDVLDQDGVPIYFIKGPIKEGMVWNEDITFDVLMPDRETSVGAISRKFAGLEKDLMSRARLFHIRPPEKASISDKVLLLGATFLINYMRY